MRKSFLSVLALVILVGTMLAPSSAWSLAPDTEVCFLSDYLGEGMINTALCPESATLQNRSFVQIDETVTKSVNIKGYSLVATTFEWGSLLFGHSRQLCPAINPKLDITDNDFGQKRVDILIC